jgi:hypothetical protein
MVRAVLAAATATGPVPSNPVGVVENPDGTWTCRFLTTIDPRVAKVKLDLLWEQGGVAMDSRAENRVVFRQTVPTLIPTSLEGTFEKNTLSGFEVVVHLPEPGTPVGEVLAHGRLIGFPPPEFTQRAGKSIVALLEGTRRELNNFQERRKHPRIPADFPIVLYPIRSDGRVETPINGCCLNVSAGGLALRMTAQPQFRYVYVVFQGVLGVTGLALLLQIIRINRENDGTVVTGRYRLDLPPLAE